MSSKKLSFYEYLLNEHPNPKFTKKDVVISFEDFAYLIMKDKEFPKDSKNRKVIERYIKKINNESKYFAEYCTMRVFENLWDDYKRA